MGRITSIEITIPGKWILAGEHAILRGFPAIAFPLPADQFALKLHFQVDPHIGSLAFEGAGAAFLRHFFEKAIADHHWQERTQELSGTISFTGTIPHSAGLGSSAAICVAFSRLFHHWGWTPGDLPSLHAMATQLENFFHGQSSGLDTAVSLLQSPLWIAGRSAEQAQSTPSPSILERVTVMDLQHLPTFTLHDTRCRSSTLECVRKVAALKSQPTDQQMGAASHLAQSGLNLFQDPETASEGLATVAKAMQQAQSCFQAWGLVSEPIQRQIKALHGQGALAVKLTGSGLGGFLVALWPNSSYTTGSSRF